MPSGVLSWTEMKFRFDGAKSDVGNILNLFSQGEYRPGA